MSRRWCVTMYMERKGNMEQILCAARGLPSGPGSEEELHDGGVTEMTSNLQSCASIL